MADAAISLGSSNLFNVGSNFKTISSGTSVQSSNVNVQDESGNVFCETNIFDITNYTQNTAYCGSDFDGDLVELTGTLTSFLENFGCTFGSKILTGLTINARAGEYVTVDFEGHNHDENAHDGGEDPSDVSRSDALLLGVCDTSTLVTGILGSSWNGFGVPNGASIDLGTPEAASPISLTLSLAMNHVDKVDTDGSHLVGKNITPRVDLSMEFSGVPDDNTAALLKTALGSGWEVDGADSNDSNSEFDSFSFTAHAHPALATV